MFQQRRIVETFYSLPGCPGSIALLADFHNADPEPVLASLRRRRPDRIAIAGDLIYGLPPEDDTLVMERQINALPLLYGCVSIAPTVVSLGNHEWMLCNEDLAAMAKTGVTVLHNAFTSTVLNDTPIILAGLSSSSIDEYRNNAACLDAAARSVRYPKAKHDRDSCRQPDTDWLTEFAAAPGYHILLSHHPEYYPLIPAGVELILSGHAHGGQWRILGHGVYAPGQGFWPKWTGGLVDGRMVISRGLANNTMVPRINNPPEIVYISGR